MIPCALKTSLLRSATFSEGDKRASPQICMLVEWSKVNARGLREGERRQRKENEETVHMGIMF